VNSVTFVSGTQVDANVSVAPGAATGGRDVTLTNGDGSTSTGSGVFTVNPAPTVSLLAPPAATANSSGVPVSISGAGFAPGAVVTFVGGGAPTVTNTVVNDSGTITVTIDTNSSGTYDVVVSNPDGGQTTLAGGFTVT
jgi:IPT/TIG domain-containing protein